MTMRLWPDGIPSGDLPFPEIRRRCPYCRDRRRVLGDDGQGCLHCNAERERLKEQMATRSANVPDELRAAQRRLPAQRALPSAAGRMVMPDLRAGEGK
jgi:hypothetical protein